MCIKSTNSNKNIKATTLFVVFLFVHSWEQRKLYDIADRFDNLRIPVAANLRIHGITPYYGANGIQDYVSGYTHDGEFVLVAEDGANDLKNYPVNYVKGRIWVNNHAHVLQGKAKLLDNKFLSYLINRADIESLLVGCGRAKLNAETMMNIVFLVPNYEEQIEIGNYLSKIDNLITLHQRKDLRLFLQFWERKQHSFLPISWEQRKLGETTQIIMGQSPDGSTYSDFPTDYILVQGNADLENGWVKPRIWTTQKTKYAVAGDLIMSVRAPAGSMGKTAYNVVLGRGVAAIKGNEFIFQVLTKMDLEGFWKKLSAGSTFESLNSDNIINANINLPSNLEQDKIGSIFENIDNLITLHQCKVFYKKVIFKNEIFNSFEFGNNIAWEQRKLWQLTIWDKKFNGVESYKQVKVIKYPYVLADVFSQIEDTSGTVRLLSTGSYIGYTTKEKAGNNLCYGEIVAIPWGGVANIKYYNGFFVTADNRIATSSNTQVLSNRYLHWWMESNITQIQSTYRGASIQHPSMNDILSLSIYLPSIEEQEKISNKLDTLDNLITLHQRIKIFFTGDYHDKKNK